MWDLQKTEIRTSPKSTGAPERRKLVVLFTASLFLCNLLEARQCNYPSLSPGPGVFKSRGWHYLGSNWGKSNLFFLLFYSKTTEWGS